MLIEYINMKNNEMMRLVLIVVAAGIHIFNTLTITQIILSGKFSMEKNTRNALLGC